MLNKYKWAFILLNLAFLLVYFNDSIMKKEGILEEGELILLELAPVDPRSLMQGDYMTLRYGISEDLVLDSMPKRGYCVVKIDEERRASRVRFQADREPLKDGEYLIEYTSSNRWNVNIGAESYFFQEGTADLYDDAKYGGVMVDKKGNSLLIGLYDEELKLIQSQP